MREKLTIAVSGLNNTDNPGPGIPVIRGLRESQIFEPRIIGLSYENLEPGVFLEGMTDKTYMIPYPSQGMDPVIARLAFINDSDPIDVLIPNFDSELVPLIKAEKQLEGMGIRTFMPTLAQYEERLKSNLPEFGRKYGLLVPESRNVSSALEIPKVCREMPGPWMVKGKFYDAILAHSAEQAVAAFFKISAQWGLPVVIQEFVKGTEVNVVALGDGKGNTIGAVPMRKLFVTDKGKAWSGISISDRKLLELTDRIISGTQWRGGMELEIIRTSDQKYYLVEINPRIPAWVYLAVGAGQNIPEALVSLALGRDPEPFATFEVGKMFIRYSWDLVIDAEIQQSFAFKGEK
jgi:carbamoyl-phosphate synthase large subunit